jgi:hypothetical protein
MKIKKSMSLGNFVRVDDNPNVSGNIFMKKDPGNELVTMIQSRSCSQPTLNFSLDELKYFVNIDHFFVSCTIQRRGISTLRILF